MENDTTLTPIQDFYKNATVLITGATGFLGRCLLEKLLRSSGPHLNAIYIVLRSKNEMSTPQQRLDSEFFSQNDEFFTRHAKYKSKIIGVGCDFSQPNLGISEQDQQILKDEVTVVFHIAATVRFDEKLKIAVNTNVRATADLLEMAKQMPKLVAFVHVSTAFSNVSQYGKTIEERFYPLPETIDYEKLTILTETLSDKVIEGITPNVLDKWPNTYTFTKAVAEDVIRKNGGQIPCAIFRPSIIVSTYQEPVKAWINNFYGPTGVAAGAGVGLLRVLHCDPDLNANIVPVDMCVNAILAIGWDVGTNCPSQSPDTSHHQKQESTTPIYHFESSSAQPITWGKFMALSTQYGVQTPTIKAFWYYTLTLQRNYFMYWLSVVFLHYLPALCIDGALFCLGKKPKTLKIYTKIQKFTSVISYFCVRKWTFDSRRCDALISRMSESDRRLFFCDLRKLDWDKFFESYIRGIRVYLIKDPLNTLPEARIKFRKLYYCHLGVKVACFVFLLWLLVNFFKAVLMF